MGFSFLISICLLQFTIACDNPAGGNSFFLGFPETEDVTGDVSVRIGLASDASASLSFSYSTPGDTVLVSTSPGIISRADAGATLTLPNIVRMSGVSRSPQAFVVETTSGGPITVTALNNYTDSCDSYLSLPVSALGTEYMPILYWPPWTAAEVLIIATQDNTTFEMSLQENRGIAFSFEGTTYQGGDVFTANMDAYDVIQILDPNDLTGNLIVSDKPIAVISGNKAVNLNINQVAPRGQVITQVPPVDAWGTSFYVVPFPGRANTIIKFVARYENTTVQVKGSVTDYEWTASFDGDYEVQDRLVFDGEVYLTVTATDPILLIQMAESSSSDNSTYSTAPAILLVPASNQWRNDHYIYESLFTTYYLLITVESENATGVKVDDTAMTSGWTAFESSTIVGQVVPVTGSNHTVSHDDDDVIIGVSVFASVADLCTTAYPASLCLPETLTTAGPPVDSTAADTTLVASTADAELPTSESKASTVIAGSTAAQTIEGSAEPITTAQRTSEATPTDDGQATPTGVIQDTPTESTATVPPCGCAAAFVTAPSAQKDRVGIYNLYSCLVDDKPVYQHADTATFLFYNESSTTWVFSDILEGSGMAFIESQAGEVDTPFEVSGNWLVEEGGVMVERVTVSVECICNKRVCPELELTSPTLANTFPGTFAYDSDINDRPAYYNSQHGVYLYFHSTGNCHFWAVAPTTNAAQWLMYSYDISPRPNEIIAPWQVATVGGWDEDENIVLQCS